MSPRSTKKDELQGLPGIGPSLASDLRALGVRRVADLKRRDPERLYIQLNRLRGERQDPCVLYAFRCAAYAAGTARPRPELLKWWNWKDRVLRALVLLACLPGCASPKTHAQSLDRVSSGTAFGRPAVLARHEGEARMLQGRKPMWIKVDPETLGSRTLTVGMEDMPPGDSIGVHKHLQEDEVVFVHRGEVEVTLGDSLWRATPGGMVFIPRGTWIGLRVTGTDTATIVFAFNVPGFEKCLRLLSAPVGTAFVPPPAQAVAEARRECHQVRRADETH